MLSRLCPPLNTAARVADDGDEEPDRRSQSDERARETSDELVPEASQPCIRGLVARRLAHLDTDEVAGEREDDEQRDADDESQRDRAYERLASYGHPWSVGADATLRDRVRPASVTASASRLAASSGARA
jgi:hypothetical protein